MTTKKNATKAMPQKGKRSAKLDKSTAPKAPAAKAEAKAKKRTQAAAAQTNEGPAAADNAAHPKKKSGPPSMKNCGITSGRNSLTGSTTPSCSTSWR